MENLLINNLGFANNQSRLEGDIDLSALVRLQDLINPNAKQDNVVRYSLTGENKRFEFPSLHLTIDTTLPMLCQRCLEVLPVPIQLSFDYVITNEITEELEDNDAVDWLEPELDMDVQALIEDELLIAMPISPMHQEACQQLKTESGESANPFAVLKDQFK